MTVKEILLRLTREDATWGYDRIQNALANLGHAISDQTEPFWPAGNCYNCKEMSVHPSH